MSEAVGATPIRLNAVTTFALVIVGHRSLNLTGPDQTLPEHWGEI
jgi:hypothetical protein